MAVGDPVQVVAPTILRLTYKHTYTNGHACDVVQDVSIDEFGEARAAAIATVLPGLTNAWQDTFMLPMCNNVTYNGMAWIDIDSLDGGSGFQGPTAGHPSAGQGTDAAASPNVAYLIHKNCVAHRGERQGRSYIPGVVETEVDENGTVSAAKKTQLQTAIDQWKADVTDMGDLIGLETIAPRVVHVHKHRSDDPDDWDWSSSNVDSYTIDNIVATQRRRLR